MHNISYLIDLIDIFAVTISLYFILRFIQKSMNVLRLIGIAVFLQILLLLSRSLHLEMMTKLISFIFAWGVLGILIVFQPEIRGMISRLGQVLFSSKKKNEHSHNTIDALLKTTAYLSQRHIGALITIEQNESLATFERRGISIQGEISHELLRTIFIPSTPLHDGAVVLRGDQISSASVYFPIDERILSTELGSRHRAALGISKVSDAVTIVVSEESGTISIAYDGELLRDISSEELDRYLQNVYENSSKLKFTDTVSFTTQELNKQEEADEN